MKWIIYNAEIVNQVTRQAVRQIRRAPVMNGDCVELAAERLGGTLLAVQTDVRKAESLRRLTELQAMLQGYDVAEWSAPAEWERDTVRSIARPRTTVRGLRYPRMAGK
jgi:hypothetical protein